MLCKRFTCDVKASLPAKASNRKQDLAVWQFTSVPYLHVTVSDPATSPGSADQCLLGDLILYPILEICYCTCTVQTAYQSGAWASRHHCDDSKLLKLTYCYYTSCCIQPCCGAELCPVCRSCALLEWTLWRRCQAHVPCMPAAGLTAGQYGLSRVARSAFTASLFECSSHLPS